MEKIGIIGAGKVGCSFGKYLASAGFFDALTGIYSKSAASTKEAADFLGVRAYDSVEELVSDSNMIFITVPDSKIAGVWKQCMEFDVAGKIFCHCSGALASTVFEGITDRQAFGYSIHPFMAVADKYTSFRQFSEALFTIEGNEARLEDVKQFLEEAGLRVQVISKESKLLYHASASLASNCMVGLTQMAMDQLMKCGFSESNAKMALKPLMLGNLSKVLEVGSVQALTGPVERADAFTVKGHLSVFEGENKEVYRLLSREILEVARKKNPDRDYSAVEEALSDCQI